MATPKGNKLKDVQGRHIDVSVIVVKIFPQKNWQTLLL